MPTSLLNASACSGPRNELAIEASTAQFPPGRYPDRISLIASSGEWDGYFDLFDVERDPEGDTVAVHYRQRGTGRVLTVLND